MNIYEELGKLDKITKNNIAQIKNHTATSLGRTISVLNKLTFNVGDIIVLDRAESWTEGGEFTCENEGILYFFSFDSNIDCHKVDYDILNNAATPSEVNVAEAYFSTLGTDSDMSSEIEIVLAVGTKFRVADVSTDDDFEEMGYYNISLEYLGAWLFSRYVIFFIWVWCFRFVYFPYFLQSFIKS